MALFITLYKVVPTFESGDEILKCDYSNESYNTFLFTTRCKLVLTSLKSSLCIKRFRRFFGMFDEELFEFWPREHWTNFHEGKSEKKASKVPKGLRKSLAGR